MTSSQTMTTIINSTSLAVFDTLRVHRICLKTNEVRATYSLLKTDGELLEMDLIYSYPETFFDKKKSTDVNLASMMTVQVAINYGLFCKKMVFDGLFDMTDKQFITDMIENTAREIYVNKFLFPNEFLVSPFDKMDATPQKKYTNAEIIFENTTFGKMRLKPENATPDAQKFAVLSSGGKDSLLTYGIVNELGEAHPIFINESGRHWYTAYNAHKYFAENEPNTVKPWCNCDRLFNWMIRQMPFIKKNFQNIRSDIYPIRLWTVAVFLFGALPVVRKRNTKNILIGNEYDCTQQINFQGITHYNALYDQSKYFDNAMTRYYARKGWNMYQFSILRSLSELLILNILVKRYPNLQRLQVSCHSAHKEGEKMLPCGKCEKCRRMIGMLKVLDEDPKRCGYMDAQIEQGLKALETKTVKQIGSDAQHLYHLLRQKNLIEHNPHTQKLAKEHPEIMMLRFDNERSMMQDMPKEVRAKLFGILEKYAQSQVKMVNRKWTKLYADDEIFDAPYFIETKN